MIDLRSDTLTQPSRAMLQSILAAPLGDAARLEPNGQGGDPTVNALEDYAAALLQKQAAAFLCSGTMGNSAVLKTLCQPGDRVLVDRDAHIYRSEKFAFSPQLGQLEAVFYESDTSGLPDPESIKAQLKKGDIRLLCLESSHNDHGGVCIPLALHQRIKALSVQYHVPIHLDGARLFNAATALGVSAAEIAQYTDTVMFCVSKGLGAPFGSMVCAEKPVIEALRSTQKLLGGALRQAGVMAAPALYALHHQIDDLAADHARAQRTAAALCGLDQIAPPAQVQTNLLMLYTKEGQAARWCQALFARGIRVGEVAPNRIRLVFHRDITDEQVEQVIQAIRAVDAQLT